MAEIGNVWGNQARRKHVFVGVKFGASNAATIEGWTPSDNGGNPGAYFDTTSGGWFDILSITKDGSHAGCYDVVFGKSFQRCFGVRMTNLKASTAAPTCSSCDIAAPTTAGIDGIASSPASVKIKFLAGVTPTYPASGEWTMLEFIVDDSATVS